VNLYFSVHQPIFCAIEIIHLSDYPTSNYIHRKNDIRATRYLTGRLLQKLSFCCCQVCMPSVHISFMGNFVVHFNSKIRLYYLKILFFLLIYCFTFMISLHPLHFRSLLFQNLRLGEISLFVWLVQKRAQFYWFLFLCCFKFC